MAQDAVGLYRLIIAEGVRFPELARTFHRLDPTALLRISPACCRSDAIGALSASTLRNSRPRSFSIWSAATCIGARWPASSRKMSAPRSGAASTMRSKCFGTPSESTAARREVRKERSLHSRAHTDVGVSRTRRATMNRDSRDRARSACSDSQVTPPFRQAARKSAMLRFACGSISTRSCWSFSPNNARIAKGRMTKSWNSCVVVTTCSGTNAGNGPSSLDCAASAKSRATACPPRSRAIL
jgi:hypothetical protein